MSDFRFEDEAMGKAYDSKLMKRLLGYARSYWKIIIFCIILMLIVTGVELIRPYLIKIAIDDHINILDQSYYSYSPDDIDGEKGIEFDNQIFIREDWLQSEKRGKPHQIVKINGDYYLAQGKFSPRNNPQLEGSEDSTAIRVENTSYPAVQLNPEEVSLFRERDISALSRIGIIFLLLLLGGFAVNYLQVFLLHRTSQHIIYNMRQEIFSHLQKMSLSYFDNNPVGRLVTRVTNDTETLNEMYTNVLVNLFKDIFLILGILLIMIRLNLRLALVVFAILPLVALTAFLFRRFARDAYRQVRIKLARINATLSENISGMKIIQIFRQENRKFKEFTSINEEYYDATLKQLTIFAVFRPAMDLLYSLALALLIWYGGGRVLEGVLQFGVLYAFINYIRKFFRPINDLSEKYNILQSAMASSERIFKILDTEEDIKDPENPETLPKNLKGKIQFDNVCFAYQKDEWVLKNIDLTIKPGETVALVGATGAGKSSIINLISRFYDIQKGKIYIDGHDIKNIPKKELRKKIGVVLQDVFLFSGDIKSNISLYSGKITENKIREAARHVNAEKFIKHLPRGYEQKVTERGSTLSAGQRQLLAFARALAFDPDILILDEATASIDTETEELIQDALHKLTDERTTIVIAHRLSTIQHADKIVVLHQGEIKEMGTHQQLLAQKGIYYDLYQLQYKEQLLAEK
ncbi:MAG: ABC transporter ATP-binding protein [Halanaerobiales bacterium]